LDFAIGCEANSADIQAVFNVQKGRRTRKKRKGKKERDKQRRIEEERITKGKEMKARELKLKAYVKAEFHCVVEVSSIRCAYEICIYFDVNMVVPYVRNAL
jgi:hypothetical protein